MKLEITVPTLPESIIEATVTKILKKSGEYVKKNETIVDLETDKIMLSITAQENGILDSILVSEGDAVKADQPVAVIRPQEESQDKPEKESKNEEPKRFGPSVRKTIKKEDINLEDIQGSGKKGRIYKADLAPKNNAGISEDILSDTKDAVEKFTKKEDIAIASEEGVNEKAIDAKIDVIPDRRELISGERIPISKIKVGIFENLIHAQRKSLTSTTFDEVNMENIINIRELYKEKFFNAHNVRLGFTSFFVKAVTQAFRSFPSVNSSMDEEAIVYHKSSDIGVTINSPAGLVTPIIRNAEKDDIVNIEKKILGLSEKAKNGSLELHEMHSGTFTITNSGFFNSMLSTPIINTPQNAILSMHKITDRPFVDQGKVRIKPIMYIALSYNYLAIDSKYSADFLSKVKELLEDPYRLLLNV